jgi:hypothetical protein
VHSQFLAAGVYRELLGAFADLLGRYFHALRQDGPQTLIPGDLLGHGHHRPVVAPLQIHTARVLLGENTFSKHSMKKRRDV